MSIKGGCACGKVRYESTENEAGGGLCHCDDCRKSSGTGHAANAFVSEDSLTITGNTKSFSTTTNAGNTMTRQFCADCGCSIVSRTTGMPGLAVLRVSSFDDPEKFNPQMVVFNRSAPSWDHQAPDVPHFEEMPPSDG
ncbi:MAG: GFA family protein [Hyphomicrobiaceae bacterium]